MNEMLIVLIVETVVVTVVGSLLHFTYDWSKENKFVAIFAAVNESTWEHIKLALSGIFLCTLVDVWFLGENPNYWLARSVSFVVPVVVIPLLFYGYRSFVKHSILPVDISIFVVAAFLSTLVFVEVLQLPAVGEWSQILSMIISIVIIAAYLLLTRFPLHHNFLFKDPITGKYGYEKVARKRARKSSR